MGYQPSNKKGFKTVGTNPQKNSRLKQIQYLRKLNEDMQTRTGNAGESGRQQAGFVNPQGLNFEIGIAIPLKNRKFEWGQLHNYKLAPGRLNIDYNTTPSLAAETRIPEMGLISINGDNDQHNHPSKYIQYGDRATVGPSTAFGYEGRIEHVRLSGGYGTFSSEPMNTTTYGNKASKWQYGGAFLRDRKLTNPYNNNDNVTIYTTGLADTWEVDYKYPNVQPMGFYRGLKSLNNNGLGRFIKTSGDTLIFNNYQTANAGEKVYAIGLPNPFNETYRTSWDGSGYISNLMTTDTMTIPLLKGECTRLLDMWSDYDCCTPTTSGHYPGNMIHDTLAAGTGLGYLLSIMYGSGVDTQARSLVRTKMNSTTTEGQFLNDAFKYSGLYGFYHPGGYKNNYGQKLVVSDHTNYRHIDGSDSLTTGKIVQYLTTNRAAMDEKNPQPVQGESKSIPLVGNTYYRLGCIYKAEIYEGGSTTVGDPASNWYLSLNMNEDVGISTNALDPINLKLGLLAGMNTWVGWTEGTSQGYLGNVALDMDDYVDSGKKAPNLEITGYMKTNEYDSAGLGVVGELTIDNIYLEHQGDLEGTQDGFITLQTLPEIGSINFSTVSSDGIKTLRLTNNSIFKVDTSGYGERIRWRMDCDFANVPQSDWDAIQHLLRWQRAGHRLTLHPYIDDLPPVMVGYMEITNVQKSHWDLTRRTFHFSFEEAD
tara:strand:- start:33666 stop:35780 length:2115 start_codon:yes stop_codon:yes gene_type:complete